MFPYRAELDQSGALLQALGAGVPAVVYDVAGLGEPVRAFGAGRVVAGRRRRCADRGGAASCSPIRRALAAARAGAERARAELTWDASAARISSCTGSSRDVPPRPLRAGRSTRSSTCSSASIAM